MRYLPVRISLVSSRISSFFCSFQHEMRYCCPLCTRSFYSRNGKMEHLWRIHRQTTRGLLSETEFQSRIEKSRFNSRRIYHFGRQRSPSPLRVRSVRHAGGTSVSAEHGSRWDRPSRDATRVNTITRPAQNVHDDATSRRRPSRRSIPIHRIRDEVASPSRDAPPQPSSSSNEADEDRAASPSRPPVTPKAAVQDMKTSRPSSPSTVVSLLSGLSDLEPSSPCLLQLQELGECPPAAVRHRLAGFAPLKPMQTDASSSSPSPAGPPVVSSSAESSRRPSPAAETTFQSSGQAEPWDVSALIGLALERPHRDVNSLWHRLVDHPPTSPTQARIFSVAVDMVRRTHDRSIDLVLQHLLRLR